MNNMPIRDIHLPEMYGWWPPAPGWWLLLFIIFMLVYGIPWLRKKRRHKTIDQQASAQFITIKTRYENHQDKAQLLQDLSVLLRQICMTYRTRKQVASLLNDSWLKQLDSLVGKTCFSSEIANLLVSGPYQKQPEFDVDKLLNNYQQWIVALPYNNGSRQDGAQQ
ncbi:MAG: hypothetical protein COB77_04675 [Gammaproteobacteria bacterium]|nr:MAG: hypothetical protein COB77_04675 [Gammaproteobacteria bacterium]